MTSGSNSEKSALGPPGRGEQPDQDMVWIPDGQFRMGSDDFYPEERPVHEVSVDGFWIDRFTVTNGKFEDFVAATGYITLAERELDPAEFPGAPAENLKPGSMLFKPTSGPVDLQDYTNWWDWAPAKYAGCMLKPGKRKPGIEKGRSGDPP